MKIEISEVWNSEGRQRLLATIDTDHKRHPKIAVWEWIAANRPDLSLANSISSHGYYAVSVEEGASGDILAKCKGA